MKKTLLGGLLAAAMTLAALPAVAEDISIQSSITKNGFRNLSKEIGAAIGYRNMAPPAPLGISGFDVGGELEAISIDSNSDYWKSAFADGSAPSYLMIPKLRARKGLPLGIDIGAMYAYVPESNVKLFGVEVSKAILEGTMATPAVGVRATYTRLTGVNDLELQTFGLDASISKGFPFLTPYAGAGAMLVNSSAKGSLKAAVPALSNETIAVPRVFGGLVFSPVPLLAFTGEVEYAVQPIYSFKAAICF